MCTVCFLNLIRMKAYAFISAHELTGFVANLLAEKKPDKSSGIFLENGKTMKGVLFSF